MKILLAVASLRRSYGGPAFSVSRLAGALAKTGEHKVGIWTPDGSAPASDLLDDTPVRLAGTAEQAMAQFGPDLVHDNGIWWRHNHQLAVLARRHDAGRIVSPHGMLEPWALRHRAWKKRLAWSLYQRRDLKCADGLQATAEAEAQTIKAMSLGPPVAIIPNGVDLPSLSELEPAPPPSTVRTALFLGRLHPVKGLPMLIKAWGGLRPESWRLRIVGPDEDHHAAEVRSAIRAEGLEAVVSVEGPVSGSARTEVFRSANLFLLPSYSENFGMVVAEALAHRIPVLTTRGTPWSVLEGRQCGWWVDANLSGLTEGLSRAFQTPDQILNEMGRRGRALVEADFSWEHVAAAMSGFYAQVMAQRMMRAQP